MKTELIQFFKQMSDLTEPECSKVCRIPHSCCSSEYCDIAEDFAKEQGVKLKPTGHKTLKFIGLRGCTVAPHLRPLCTLHTCEINGRGFKTGNLEWTKRYFELRNKIEEELAIDKEDNND